jgi:hypothetical protein
MSSLEKFFGGSSKEKDIEEGSGDDTKSKQSPEVEGNLKPYRISTARTMGLDILSEPKGTGKGNKAFCPRDLVHYDLSTAWIMTFGYDADVVRVWKAWKPASHNNV